MLGELDAHQIDALLHSQGMGRLGCHANGQTYVVPLTYVYDGKYLYGHTGAGLKVQMMRANPEVCFEVDHLEDMANWQSVIVWGTYEELQGDEAARAMQRLMERLGPLVTSETSQPSHSRSAETAHTGGAHKFHAGMTNGHPVMYRIRITRKTGRFEQR